MREPVLLPDLGGAEATLSLWFVQVGEPVDSGDRLVEILVGGATLEVTAPCPGHLSEKCARPDELLQPGQILGYIDNKG